MFNEIRYLYPTASQDDFMLQDDSDGNGPRFVYWNSAKLGEQPTIEGLLAVKPTVDASDTAKANLTQLRVDTYTDVLAFLATLPSAPMSIKNAAVLAATEKAKVK